jgi:hypothetical protein
MTTFLLLLSLLLNAAAIFAIILLYLRQNRLVEAEKKQGRIIKEIEEVFSAYLLELKEENDKFIEKMSNTQSAADSVSNTELKVDSQDKYIADGNEETLQSDTPPRIGKAIAYNSALKAYRPIPQSPSLDGERQLPGLEDLIIKTESAVTPELSFSEQVAELQKQGLTVEEIARRLDKGKTEIELLLKFRQNT